MTKKDGSWHPPRVCVFSCFRYFHFGILRPLPSVSLLFIVFFIFIIIFSFSLLFFFFYCYNFILFSFPFFDRCSGACASTIGWLADCCRFFPFTIINVDNITGTFINITSGTATSIIIIIPAIIIIIIIIVVVVIVVVEFVDFCCEIEDSF